MRKYREWKVYCNGLYRHTHVLCLLLNVRNQKFDSCSIFCAFLLGLCLICLISFFFGLISYSFFRFFFQFFEYLVLYFYLFVEMFIFLFFLRFCDFFQHCSIFVYFLLKFLSFLFDCHTITVKNQTKITEKSFKKLEKLKWHKNLNKK